MSQKVKSVPSGPYYARPCVSAATNTGETVTVQSRLHRFRGRKGSISYGGVQLCLSPPTCNRINQEPSPRIASQRSRPLSWLTAKHQVTREDFEAKVLHVQCADRDITVDFLRESDLGNLAAMVVK
ncbi:hypothetical protein TNCV_4405211 [Trichonephila clavipes]|uniref:Uncharacterized protein n=1 Tax=Trichonephila clavipes TaxID=2585209 RepID=A0A8X6VAX3_TRICX|nr:hypothetical protein TNCV_4405211 [Trichonephila clavipes]